MSDEVRGRDFIAAVYGGVDGYLNVRTLPPVEEVFFNMGEVDALDGGT